MGIDLDRDLILQSFAAQSDEGLAALEQALIDLETRPEDDETLHLIFRIAHTIKGDSAMLGFSALVTFSHALEDLLERVRDRTVPADGKLISVLLESVDALRELLSNALDGRDEEKAQHAPLLQTLRELSGAAAKRKAKKATAKKGKVKQAQSQARASAERAGETLEAPESGQGGGRRQTFRVSVEVIDRLLNLTGELAIARSRITQMLETSDVAANADVLEAQLAMDHLFSELQHEVMKVRMVPVGPVFRQHIRSVRDLAIDHGKIARLEIEGEDSELDTTVIEQIRDPLGHMIRNAIAHGIESPEEREARGKDPCGLVTLRAWHEGANIMIRVADDGAGLDRDRIRERARALGLASDNEQLPDAAAADLIFQPGVSTADGTTVTSGRGVGMDVVRRNVEALRGSVKAESVPGEGTAITIQLPLTLAIIDGFAVGVGDDTYILPLGAVVECLDMPAEEAQRSLSEGVIPLRGETLPYVRLGHALGSSGKIAARQKIVVVRHDGGDAGVVVDALYGEREAVIKPLDRNFRNLPGVVGATIMGDGRVALILDVPALLRKVVRQKNGREGHGGGSAGPSNSSATSERAEPVNS